MRSYRFCDAPDANIYINADHAKKLERQRNAAWKTLFTADESFGATVEAPSGAYSRSDFVREYDKLAEELARYREREKHCATMDKAEKLALIHAMQEIGDVVCLSGLASSPAQIVAAVKNLHANV